jgi:hypothetical protein
VPASPPTIPDAGLPDACPAPRLDRTSANARPRLRQTPTKRSEVNWLSHLRTLIGGLHERARSQYNGGTVKTPPESNPSVSAPSEKSRTLENHDPKLGREARRKAAKFRLSQKQLLSGSDDSIEAMTERLGIAKGHLTSLVRLSLLAPDIVRALLEGRHPIELTPTRDWSEQQHFFGFADGRPIISGWSAL